MEKRDHLYEIIIGIRCESLLPKYEERKIIVIQKHLEREINAANILSLRTRGESKPRLMKPYTISHLRKSPFPVAGRSTIRGDAVLYCCVLGAESPTTR